MSSSSTPRTRTRTAAAARRLNHRPSSGIFTRKRCVWAQRWMQMIGVLLRLRRRHFGVRATPVFLSHVPAAGGSAWVVYLRPRRLEQAQQHPV